MIAKTMLKINNRFYAPGQAVEESKELLEKLKRAGLVTATIEPSENAMIKKPKSRKKKGGLKKNGR